MIEQEIHKKRSPLLFERGENLLQNRVLTH